MAYCLDDGKIDQESEFETELYNSLLKQLKEMTNNISDEILALIWLYLQTIGKSAEPLLMNKELWKFGKKDFRSAILTLVWDEDIENDAATLAVKELIVNNVKSQNECPKKWAEVIYKCYMYNEVCISIFRLHAPDTQFSEREKYAKCRLICRISLHFYRFC